MGNEVDLASVRNYFGSGYPQVKIMARAADDQPTYIALGARGSAVGSPNWKVIKITYVTGASGDLVFDASQTSPDNSIASDYATLVYG